MPYWKEGTLLEPELELAAELEDDEDEPDEEEELELDESEAWRARRPRRSNTSASHFEPRYTTPQFASAENANISAR